MDTPTTARLLVAAIVLPEIGRYLAWVAVPLGVGAFVMLLWH